MARRRIGGLPKPAGLLAEICRNRGIRIPDEVALMGVDNDELICKGTTPPLTSVALSIRRAGCEAAAVLDRLMAGKKVVGKRALIRPTHVETRQSTDLIAVADANLAKTIRFIRQNANRVILAKEVAAFSGLSRRALQDRFQRVTGHPLSDEIARTRVQHISRLLVETNMPIASIAQSMGYAADAHIARFFRRCTGMTPLQYRRAHR
ncbi:MAG: helix-turn-helix domain-containing protein [Verrucomicrobiae bacterium]|nr:helix-turn-helix domain-containing protein [Verrucomicrobiae bacterium]